MTLTDNNAMALFTLCRVGRSPARDVAGTHVRHTTLTPIDLGARDLDNNPRNVDTASPNRFGTLDLGAYERPPYQGAADPKTDARPIASGSGGHRIF
jgi:hypothetical protein